MGERGRDVIVVDGGGTQQPGPVYSVDPWGSCGQHYEELNGGGLFSSEHLGSGCSAVLSRLKTEYTRISLRGQTVAELEHISGSLPVGL